MSIWVTGRKLCFWGLSLAAPACGHAGAPLSSVAAIATDLPDDGSPNKTVNLYWVTDDHIFRGGCPNRDVLLRSQCTVGIQSMMYADFKQQLDGGLSDTIRQLQDEARKIQDAMVAIDAQVQETLAQINKIEQQNGGLSQELQDLRVKMQNFETIVAEYRQQLTLIEQALQQAVDQDMVQLHAYVVAQLSKYQEQLTGISQEVADLMQQLHDAEGQLLQLREQADKLNARLANLKIDLAVVQEKLQHAYDDFSVYQLTLDRLNNGIIFPILADNVWFQRERQFVKRFDQVFHVSP